MAIGSITPNIQPIWKQQQVQQAQRTADQAEQNVRALQDEASNAQRTADRAQEKARSLNAQAERAQGIASLANLRLRAAISQEKTGAELGSANSQTAQAQPALLQARVIANTQGQAIGTIVNVIA